MKRSLIALLFVTVLVTACATATSDSDLAEQRVSATVTPSQTLSPAIPSPTSTFAPTATLTPSPITGYLPDGALLNLGRGEIYDIALSSDGTKIAVGSVGGIYILDGFDFHEITFIATESPNYRVTGVDFSSDGKFLVALATFKDYTNEYLNLYDSNSYQLIKQTPIDYGHTRVLFSPDQSYVTVLGRKNIYTWDYQKGKLQNIYHSSGDANAIYDMDFSPSGELFIASGTRVASIDAGGGIVQRYDTLFEERVYAVAVSPDGKFAAGRQDNTIVVWDTETGEEILRDASEFLKESMFNVSNIAFSEDGRFVYTGKSGGLGVWNIEKGAYEKSLKAESLSPEMHYHQVAVLANGHVLGVSYKEEIVIWEGENNQAIYTSARFSNEPMAGAFSPDGSSFALSISPEKDANELRVLDTQTGYLTRRVDQLGTVWGVNYSSADKYVVAKYNGAAFVLDSQSLEAVCTPYGRLPVVFFSPDDDQFAVAIDNGFLIGTSSQCSPVREFTSTTEESFFLISDDWTLVFEGTEDGKVNIYNAQTGALKTTLAVSSSSVEKMITSSSGEYLAASTDKKTVFFDLATGEEVGTIGSPLYQVAMQNGRVQASANNSFYLYGQLLKVWQAETLQSFTALQRNRNLTQRDGPVISPDGKLAAMSGMDSKKKGISIYVIEIETDSVLYRYEGHSILFPNIQMVFSPDSQSLVSMSRGDGSVLLWNTQH